MTSSLNVICHGARGSMPVDGTDFERFGGLTTCYEVELDLGHRLLVDLGTGIHHLAPTIDPDIDRTFDVFFTHSSRISIGITPWACHSSDRSTTHET